MRKGFYDWTPSDIDLYLGRIERLQKEVDDYWNTKNIFRKIFGWKHMLECHNKASEMLDMIRLGIGLPSKREGE